MKNVWYKGKMTQEGIDSWNGYLLLLPAPCEMINHPPDFELTVIQYVVETVNV